jgi:hypothetical protein
MQIIKTQVNLRAISHRELDEMLNFISQFQKFTSTPRADLGDTHLPKALPFNKITSTQATQREPIFTKKNSKYVAL